MFSREWRELVVNRVKGLFNRNTISKPYTNTVPCNNNTLRTNRYKQFCFSHVVLCVLCDWISFFSFIQSCIVVSFSNIHLLPLLFWSFQGYFRTAKFLEKNVSSRKTMFVTIFFSRINSKQFKIQDAITWTLCFFNSG